MGAMENVTAHGVTLTLENGVLYASPVECLTDELRAFIRDNKPQLIAEITGQSCQTCAYASSTFGYWHCMSDRDDLLKAKGGASKFSDLPTDGGLTCSEWLDQWQYGWRDLNKLERNL